jgi:hypothetical protein
MELMPYAMHFQLGRFLIVAGLVLVVLGIAVSAGPKLPFGGFGRLPGDIVHKGKNVQFYFPIVSCLIVSALLTLAMWIVTILTRK